MCDKPHDYASWFTRALGAEAVGVIYNFVCLWKVHVFAYYLVYYHLTVLVVFVFVLSI